MNKFISNNIISLIGAKVNYGQTKLGVEKSYDLLIKEGLIENLKNWNYYVKEIGSIDTKDNFSFENNKNLNYNCKFNDKKFIQIGHYNRQLSELVENSIKSDSFSLVIGGDHSIASGSIYGQIKNRPNLKLLWVDAHADINTPEFSLSNNYHGMPAAHLLGVMKGKDMIGFDWITKYLDPKDIVYLGLRALDEFEKDTIKKLGIKVYSPYDIEHFGIRNVMDSIFNDLNLSDKTPLACTFDIDSCDQLLTPGTGTPVSFGITEREAIYLMKRLNLTKNLVHLDMVEINNDLELDKDKGKTLKLGMNLIEYAFGKEFYKFNN